MGKVSGMKKTDKIIVIFYLILVISYVISMVYINNSFANVKFSQEDKKPVTELRVVKTVDVDKIKIFDTMADMRQYPVILPNKVLSVNIVSQTGNETVAEVVVMKQYIKTKLLVKHTLVPYSKPTRPPTIANGRPSQASSAAVVLWSPYAKSIPTPTTAPTFIPIRTVSWPHALS